MKGIGRTIKDLRIISYFSKGKRWMILSLCIILALIIWLLQSLNGTYTKAIEMEIAPIKLPARYSVDNTADLPKNITVKISSTGNRLLNFSLSNRLFNRTPLLHLEVDSLRIDPEGGFWSATGSELTRQVRSSYPELDNYFNIGEDKITVSPDYIGFTYAPMDETVLPIVFNSQIDFGEAKNRFLESWHMGKEEVKVYGLKSKLDSLRINDGVVLTDSTCIKMNKLGLNSLNVALIAPNGVKLAQDSVRVELMVEELSYHSFLSKEIQVRNLPDDLSIRLFPSSIKITYLAEESSNENEIQGKLRLYIDLTEINDISTTKKLKVNFEEVPNKVHMIQLEPDQVEFIIEEKSYNK